MLADLIRPVGGISIYNRKAVLVHGKNTLQYGAWKQATWFNERHQEFAWVSLIWVMVADLYVRLLSMGVISDLNTWGL